MRVGLDIGSTTIKCVVLDENDTLLYSTYERHYSHILEKAQELLRRIDAEQLHGRKALLSISGSAGMGLADSCGVPFVQEVFSTRVAVKRFVPATDCVIELGGEDAKILFLTNGTEVRMNGSCAGGTGAFIDQMATLLKMGADEMDRAAQQATRTYTIASRCGVFAKSDIQPLINQGAQAGDIAASIYQAVVNQTIAGLAQGRPIQGNILYLGGPLTFSKTLRRSFDKTLGVTGTLPENSLLFVAMGAAFYADEVLDLHEVAQRLDNYSATATYVSLPPLFADKQEYEETFETEDGNLPEQINSSALNDWVFNEDTIREVLNILMTNGLRVDYGNKIGKTIIFAKNHRHAEKILEVFGKEYPHLKDYAKVIDNYLNYAQSAIDEFSDPKKMPQIAISVDMLDTGIDVPEVLNLVFFKKVMSKAKFWQMIGRGTRLCPGLMDGADKDKFYIFDFCGNFEFFRMNKGKSTANTIAVQGAIFQLKFEMSYKLQDLAYQTEQLKKFRSSLIEDMTGKVRELNRDNFAVRQHLKYVELYSSGENYQALTYADTLVARDELAPLIEPEKDDAQALRFDALMYGIELAYLAGKKYSRGKHDLIKRARGLTKVANIPEITKQAPLIEQILHTDYLDRADVNDFEKIRKNLRDLVKYIPKEYIIYETNMDDEVLSTEWNESELENDDLKNYKAKAEFYIREHQNESVIAKLKGNIPLNSEDVKELEKILWSDLGTKADYEAEYGEKPLGEFVRGIVGLDMNAAKQAFSEYLDSTNLDSRQIYFVNQIVEYIVQNGMMKDLSVLQDSPFTDQGSIVDVFTDLSVWMGIRKVIDQVNANAAA